MGLLPLQERDVNLISALKPFTSPKAQRFIDILLDIHQRPLAAGVEISSQEWLKGELKQITVNAFSLFLILILLLLAQPSTPPPSDGKTSLVKR